MKQNKKPMSLRDLPQHLEHLRETGNMEESTLVDVGRIVQPKRSFFSQYQSALLSMLFLMVFGTGFMLYSFSNSITDKQYTVILDTYQPSQLISDGETRILSVKKIDNSTYEVELSTRKNKSSLFNWLYRKNINKAELKK